MLKQDIKRFTLTNGEGEAKDVTLQVREIASIGIDYEKVEVTTRESQCREYVNGRATVELEATFITDYTPIVGNWDIFASILKSKSKLTDVVIDMKNNARFSARLKILKYAVGRDGTRSQVVFSGLKGETEPFSLAS